MTNRNITALKIYIFVFCFLLKNLTIGIPLTVQWLRLCISKAGIVGLIPGQGTKILHDVWHGQHFFFLIILKKKKRNKPKLTLKWQNGTECFYPNLETIFQDVLSSYK